MEQQQFKVSFPLGTKLLISVGLLLFVVIVFLNISTIFILRDDKRAYTYQAQSNEAVLAGREFVNTARHALDMLRIAMANVDPRSQVTPAQSAMLQNLVDHQTEVALTQLAYANTSTGALVPFAKVAREKSIKELGIEPAKFDIPPEWMMTVMEDLLKNSYALVNLSTLAGAPYLGVLFADVNLKDLPKGMPVAIGIVSLKGFGSDLSGTQLTIANRLGWVLYDKDPTVFFSRRNIAEDPLFVAAAGSQLSTGAKEYEANETHYLGSYVHPGLDMVVITKTEWEKAMRATYTLIEKFILLGGMAVGGAVVFAILFAKTLTAPLNRLYEATKEVARGNFDVKLTAQSRDEIGALAGSFNQMSRRIQELIQESVQRVYLENELAIASTVQQNLIPPDAFKNDHIEIQSHYQSASECGGDWWGFFGVGNKMTLMIADATGHGLPSALMTASARSCFSVMHKLAQEDPDFTFSPSAMLSYANRVIFDASLGKIMMTFFIGVIDFDKRTLTFSSAGHNPPWLFQQSDGAYKLKSLVAVGQRLGESRDAPEFEEKSVEISPKDILFLYTDGLTEGKDQAGEMYGKKRARKMVESSLSAGPTAVIRNLVADFLKHNAGKALDDDLTVASAIILPPGGTVN